MRITIIQDDGVVGIDGLFREVDLSQLDPQIRAIQFNTDSGKGHIEFDPNPDGTYPPNQDLTDITPYEWAIDAWDALTPPPPAPPTLEELKAIKRAAINNERDTRETQGFTFMGKTFDSDQRSTDRIQMGALAAQSALLSGQQFNINWTTADNSIITLDAPLMLGLAAAFATYGATLHEIAKQLKAQVDAASSAAELEMIAWPS